MRLPVPVRVLVWAAAVLLGAWAIFRAVEAPGPDPVAFEMRAAWMAPGDTQTSVSQFRQVILVPSAVRSAWVAVAAHEGFEVIVNGASAGRSFLWRPTRAFQTGLTETGQRVASPEPLIDLSFPREYQWEGHRGHRLPTFFDLAPFLVRGRNVIGLEVETRAPPAAVAVEGEILLWSGERIRIESGPAFRVAPSPPRGARRWTESDFSDLDWPPATVVDAPPGGPLRVLDPDVYREPFAGQWLSAPGVVRGAAWFETHWNLAQAPGEAWIRVVANRPFELFVNDRPARVADARPQELDTGDWIVGARMSVDAPAAAESLDPDEVGSLFVGPRFATARHDTGAAPAFDPDQLGSSLVGGSPAGARLDVAAPGQSTRTRRSAAVPAWEAKLRGADLDRAMVAGQGVAPAQGPASLALAVPPPAAPMALDRVAPEDLAHEAERTVYYAYSVQRLLHAGDNRIAIRVAAPEGPRAPVWPAKLAVDGMAHGAGDAPAARLVSQDGWAVHAQAADGSSITASDAVPGALAVAPGLGAAGGPAAALPRLQYRGTVLASSAERVVASLLLAALAVALLAWLPSIAWRPRFDVHRATWVLVAPAALIAAAFLVDASWGERDEVLWLLPARAWRWVLVAAFLLGASGAAIAAVVPRRPLLPSWPARLAIGERVWAAAVGAVLIVCGVLRAYAMQGQPLDDDELASAQAALSIARSWVPRFNADVYYTRGPLYHYIVGGSVRLFGESVWALRLPSVLFAVGTAYLIYLVGARLLKSRWTGLVAAALYAIHPYAIFVGHLVRFYQQQQFFALATAYWFCRGFVSEQRMSARYMALAAFTCACLSQELSVVLVPPLLVVWFLSAQEADDAPGDRGASGAFLVTCACAAAVVVMDILVFQTRCLTKLEGISPNVEATLAFHFISPMNLLALFVSYSRLHLALSLILVATVPLVAREKNASAVALLVVLFLGVLSTNLLVTGESLRYQYWLVPIWLVLGVHGVRAAALAAGDLGEGAIRLPVARRGLGLLVGALALGAVVLSWSPWRIGGSYASTLLGDSTSAFAYVRTHLRPGDRVAATEPHAHAGLIEIGRIDYDLAVPLLHDFVYRRDGRLVDRNGSAQVISTLDELREAVATHDRLWVLVNREKFRSRGQDIFWDYPAARVELFLRQNLEVEYQSYMWTVFLWDAHSGKFHSLPPDARVSWDAF